MHPCELENSALASLVKRLTNTEKRVLVEKIQSHLTTTGKEMKRELREKESNNTLKKQKKKRKEKYKNLLAHSLLLRVLTTYNNNY